MHNGKRRIGIVATITACTASLIRSLKRGPRRMILFLTGPFGIGKTTTAEVLVERMPGALLYDPEIVGACLQAIVRPIDEVGDFQDLAVWRRLVVDVAHLLIETYGRSLVVPMTVWRHDYFIAITDGLRRIDPALLCVRLTVSEDVLRQRILTRPDGDGPHDWCLTHLDVGLRAARDPAFGVEVHTDQRTPSDVADAIMALLPQVG